MVIELATVLTVDGVVNLAQVATAPMLENLAFLGCALGLYFIWQTNVTERTVRTVTARANSSALQ
ncbi:MAG: hypothetical protein ACI8PT_001092 [Gammaproteobacteria bacterium]